MRPRVLEAALDFPVDPAAAFSTLYAHLPNSFWLDSAAPDQAADSGADPEAYAASGMSYLGTSATLVTAGPDGGAALFDALRAPLAGYSVRVRGRGQGQGQDQGHGGGSGFALGWVGWFGYELRAATLGDPVGNEPRHPAAAFLWVDRCVAVDPSTGRAVLRALGERWDGELAEWRDATTDALRDPAEVVPGFAVSAAPLWRYDDETYLRMIRDCQRAIADGDAYQLCLTNEATVAGPIDPVATYLALRASSPTHHGGLIRAGGTALVSATPERFLSVSPNGVVETKPIKGTRPRGHTAVEDDRMLRELLHSDKERAENVMIVDLMRNDLGRVCETGSVRVPALLTVESYAHVHQLVSTVRGRLRAGLDGLDAIAACFPAGSMTGAPKLSATRILDRIEQRPRGVYSGAFGYLGVDGAVDLGMVIRSAVIDEQGATIGSGGGITALSVPDEELAEVKLKADAVIAALQARAAPIQ